MKRIATAAAAITMAGAAYAADMPLLKAPMMAPAAPSWTGFYVGGNVGYGWSTNTTTTFTTTDTGFGGFTAGTLAGSIPTSVPLSARGAVGGAEAGYNLQVNNFVLGVEGDLSSSWAGGTASYNFPRVRGFQPSNISVSRDLDWFGTIRARLGVLWNNVMFYGTGGVAFGQTTDSYTFGGPTWFPPNLTIASGIHNTSGWVGGGGIEWLLTSNLSIKGEFLLLTSEPTLRQARTHTL